MLILVLVIPLLPNVGIEPRSVVGDYVAGRLDAEGVIQQLVPGAEAAAFINRQSDPGRVMALDFPAPFLFDRPWVAEGLVNIPPMTRWLNDAESADDLLAELRRRDICWIVVTPGYGGGRPESLVPVASSPEEAALVLGLRQHLDLVFSEENVDVWRVRKQRPRR